MAQNIIEANGKDYHLFARPSSKAKNKVWWFWTWEYRPRNIDGNTTLEGIRKRESTGKRVKAEAIEYVKKLAGAIGDTLQDYVEARGFFIRGRCPYIRHKELQNGLSDTTIHEHVYDLQNRILPALGKYRISDLTGVLIENTIWSMDVAHQDSSKRPLSNSKKDGIWNALKIVLSEAHREGRIPSVPTVRRLRAKGTSRRRGSLTKREVTTLFPDSTQELEKVWSAGRIQPNGLITLMKDGRDPYGLMFGIMFKVMLHTGMRPGEGRAVMKSWIYAKYSGVFIKKQINSSGQLANLKKSTDEDPRYRFVKIPRRTMEMLVQWMRDVEGDFLFTISGKPVSKDYLVDRFRVGLKNTGIEKRGRLISPYSLRFTYRSRLEGYLDPETLRETMAHRDEEISDHYLHLTEEQFQAYDSQQEQIETAWA